MQLNTDDTNFFKEIEKELYQSKYEKLKYLENKIRNSTEKANTLPVENAAYLKQEILPILKNDYYKTYLELAKKEKMSDDNK